MAQARHGALGVLDPTTGAPVVSRVAVGSAGGAVGGPAGGTAGGSAGGAADGAADGAAGASVVGFAGGAPLLLVSTLSQHTAALRANPACSLLVGQPGPKGDPLTHPRLTLQARAEVADKAALRAVWLARHPKAALYIDFGDFIMLRLVVSAAFLNGGFGRAFHLTPADLDLSADSEEDRS